jgi:uncharacterized protein YecE (DUF72 family)
MSSCCNLRQPSLCRRNHGVAFALVDHPRMPRPNEVCRLGDPIRGGFAYVRRLGARKGIEKLTLVWDRAIVDQVAELREWVRFLKPIQKRGVIIYAFANNHYAGSAPETVRLLNETLAGMKSRLFQNLQSSSSIRCHAVP